MGKTVTTYLIDGDPQGTQYAFISNKILQIYKVISPISDKTGGLLAVARDGRFLCACFMTLSS